MIDFDARDPRPGATRRGSCRPYDSGDHLHPNDAGYQAMANAVRLSCLSQTRRDDDDAGPVRRNCTS